MFTDLKRKVFQQALALQKKGQLYITDINKNVLFEEYLKCFPENIRQEYNCSCCKSFLNTYGGIVVIDENYNIYTLWDFEIEGIYSEIPKKLSELVKNCNIKNIFLSEKELLGKDYNFEYTENGESIKWEHFCIKNYSPTTCTSKQTNKILSESYNDTIVFKKSLETISLNTAQIVMGLIDNNSLYRGSAYKHSLDVFITQKRIYDKLNSVKLDNFIWANAKKHNRLKNTAIGTLLLNIENGVLLEKAVKSYEKIVAPTNYKRPTSSVSLTQIDSAKKVLEEENLLSALNRRFANKFDLDSLLNNAIYVNRAVKELDPFEKLKQTVPVTEKNLLKAVPIKFSAFKELVNNSSISKIELYLDNNISNNFMSLLTAEDDSSEKLFNWDSHISWTYHNNLTDSIAEKVKKAGGSLDGVLRVSLEWFNEDDLDLHIIEPDNKRIYYLQKFSNKTLGRLDVDANANQPCTNTPVENIIYPSFDKLLKGAYTILVNNYRKREHENFGFNIEIVYEDETHTLTYNKPVPMNSPVTVGHITVTDKISFTPVDCVEKAISSITKCNLNINQFQEVEYILNSPNSSGMKHTFFILKGAYYDKSLRGFFNEHLKPSLSKHGKVFELLANQFIVNPQEDQLTGIGISENKKEPVTLRVTDNSKQTLYKILMGE